MPSAWDGEGGPAYGKAPFRTEGCRHSERFSATPNAHGRLQSLCRFPLVGGVSGVALATAGASLSMVSITRFSRKSMKTWPDPIGIYPFDEDYRLVLSKAIRDHIPSQSLSNYFLSKRGQQIELPKTFRPLTVYLEAHRKGGEF